MKPAIRNGSVLGAGLFYVTVAALIVIPAGRLPEIFGAHGYARMPLTFITVLFLFRMIRTLFPGRLKDGYGEAREAALGVLASPAVTRLSRHATKRVAAIGGTLRRILNGRRP
jgi:hypothetical protein